MKHMLICSNPDCRRKFTPDAEHRYGAACCKLCARALTVTPRMTSQRQTNTHLSVIAPRPSIHRKAGRDNRSKTE